MLAGSTTSAGRKNEDSAFFLLELPLPADAVVPLALPEAAAVAFLTGVLLAFMRFVCEAKWQTQSLRFWAHNLSTSQISPFACQQASGSTIIMGQEVSQEEKDRLDAENFVNDPRYISWDEKGNLRYGN